MMNQEKKNREALKNLEPNAMKKEANANIRNQSAVSVAALAFGMLLLVFVFIFSNIYIKKRIIASCERISVYGAGADSA